jgi:hypothetical protein
MKKEMTRIFSFFKGFLSQSEINTKIQENVLESKKTQAGVLLDRFYQIQHDIEKATDVYKQATDQLKRLSHIPRAAERITQCEEDYVIDICKANDEKNLLFPELISYLKQALDKTKRLAAYDYCNKTHDFERHQLPQISKDVVDDIIIELNEQVGVSLIELKISNIKPTQNQLDDDKVRSMIENLPETPKRIFIVSQDFFLLDGHHEWAARLEIDPSTLVKCYCVNMPMSDLINWFDTTTEIDVEKRDINGQLQKALDYTKLHKKVITDKRGKKITKWVKNNPNEDKERLSAKEDDQPTKDNANEDDEKEKTASIDQFTQKINQASDDHLKKFVADDSQSADLRELANSVLQTRVLTNQAKQQEEGKTTEINQAIAIGQLIQATMPKVKQTITIQTQTTEEYIDSLTPPQFNYAFDRIFAKIIAEAIGGKIQSTKTYSKQLQALGAENLPDHMFVEKDDRFYDSESPQGVDDVTLLPIYQRQVTNQFLEYARNTINGNDK